MVQAIAENLSYIVAVAISPMPLVALLFLLITRSRSSAAVWTLGWVIAVFVGTGLSAAFGHSGAGEATTGSSDSGGINWVAWIIAILFLVLAVRTLTHLPKPDDDVPVPKWITGLTRASIWVVLGLAILLLLANAKNLPMYIAMGTNISAANLSGAQEWITILIVTLLSSATPIAVTAVAYVLGDKAKEGLNALRDWLVHNNALVMGLLFLLLGVAQLSKAIASLS